MNNKFKKKERKENQKLSWIHKTGEDAGEATAPEVQDTYRYEPMDILSSTKEARIYNG